MHPDYISNNYRSYFPSDSQAGERFVPVTIFQVDYVKDYYLVSNYGRVFHRFENCYLKQYKSASGYLSVSLEIENGYKTVYVHRLVLKCHGDLNTPVKPIYDLNIKLDVNHIDGNKENNDIKNLEWASRRENILHAYRTGLHPIGVNSKLTKIKDEGIIHEICILIQNGYTNKDIVASFGGNVTISEVQDIRSGHGWKHISKNYDFHRRKGKLFTEKIVNDICLYFQNNKKPDTKSVNDHCKDAMNFYNYDCTPSTIDSVRKIYNRKYYINISRNYNF